MCRSKLCEPSVGALGFGDTMHDPLVQYSRPGNTAGKESFFSSAKSEVADRFDSCGEAKMELFDYIEVFYSQRRWHSTLGQISPAATQAA